MPSRNYRDLIAWQKAIQLAVDVYQSLRQYPSDERFGLVSQTKRAVTSIAANIAEGEGRGGNVEFIRFLRIAHGSLREVETHLILGSRLDFLPADQLPALLEKCGEVGRIIMGLIRSKKPKDDGN
jgi:four helix bundle protein